MTTAVLALLTSLVGLAIGHFLSSVNEHRKWLREKRFELASKFLESIAVVHRDVMIEFGFRRVFDSLAAKIKSGDVEVNRRLYENVRENLKDEFGLEPTEEEFASALAQSSIVEDQKDAVVGDFLAEAGLPQEIGEYSKRVNEQQSQMSLLHGQMAMIFDSDVCDKARALVLSVKPTDDLSELHRYVEQRDALIRSIHDQLKHSYLPAKFYFWRKRKPELEAHQTSLDTAPSNREEPASNQNTKRHQ